MTCMPSLVASNIRLTSVAESTVRCLLFSRQRWRTRSSNDWQAIAFRISFSVSVMSRPEVKSFRSRWQSCRKFPLATDVFGRTWPPPWLHSSWLLRVLLCTLYTLSSISFSLFRFSRPYLNSLPVEGQINFSAFVANKAHQVAFSPRCICWEVRRR